MRKVLTLALALGISTASMLAQANDCMLSEVKWVPMTWAPKNYLPADGSLLSIAQYPALYSLLGPLYGGDGINTFGLPDLRGRTAIGQGQAPGLPNFVPGEKLGTDITTADLSQLTPHTHDYIPSTVTVATTTTRPGTAVEVVSSVSQTSNPTEQTSVEGGGQPISNMQPSLVMTPVICVNGLYPQRW